MTIIKNFANLIKSSRNSNGLIDIRALLLALNWRESPVAPPRTAESDSFGNDDKRIFESTTLERQNLKVNYANFVAELRG